MFIRLLFQSQLQQLKEDKIISPIKRRICQNIEFQMQDKMKTNLSVNYNTTRLNSV